MTRAAAARRVALTLALGLVGPLAAEASTSRDTSFKPASFAAAPQLVTPSLVEELRAIEAKASKAAECVALCDIAAAVEAHPFGVPSAETPRRSEDAWGNYRFTSELETSHNRFGFTGHYWDKEASLYYAKARYYDPFTARFTQADSFLGTIDDPPSLHRYFYANDNPTMYVDPTGHISVKGLFRGAGNVIAEPFRLAADVLVAGVGVNMMDLPESSIELSSMLGRGQQARLREGQSLAATNVKGSGEVAFGVFTLGIGPAIVQHYELAKAYNSGQITIDQYDEALSEMAGGQAAAAAIGSTMAKASGKTATGRSITVVESEPFANITPQAAALADLAMGPEGSFGVANVAPSVATPAVIASSTKSNGRTHITYEFKNPHGEVVYVGRASGVGTPEQVMQGRLARGHDIFKANPGLTPVPKAVQGNLPANMGAEGVLYEQHLRDGAKLLNDPKSPPLSSKPSKAAEVKAKIDAYSEDLKRP